jgi:hypothetical protein
MKKIALLIASLAMAVTVMAQGYPDAVMSRTLTMTPPVAGYVLSTDGRVNNWILVNNLLSGTALTVTKQTVAITASGANSRITFTNYYNPVVQSATVTNIYLLTTNVAYEVTNITWSTAVYTVASNAVVAVTVTDGGNVLTNVTASVP